MSYAVCIDYVLEDVDTGETEMHTTTIQADDKMCPGEAADLWCSKKEDEYRLHYYVYTNDVYAP